MRYRYKLIENSDSEDNVGNECVVVYVDNAWNRTVRTLSEIDQLPSSVRYRLLTINQEARNDEFWEIKEVTQASINGTYYILCYLQDTPKLKNLVHTHLSSTVKERWPKHAHTN